MDNKYTYENMISFDNLYKAHKNCRKGKRWKDSVAKYDIRGFESTILLKQKLENQKYKLCKYNCFTLNERGKIRNIKSIKYPDRIVQKSLMENILIPLIVPTFVDTNCASLRGKGTDYALKKCKKHLQSQVKKHGINGYILSCDMKNYFESIPHDLLNEFYEEKIHDKKIIDLIKNIHASIPDGVGVPLGNQLSQLDALIALSPLDHIIKEKFHIKGYCRYMDDFYLIHQDKEYLKKCLNFIKEWVEKRGMKLNSKKTKIVPIKQGINFLGFHFYVTEKGKVIQKLLKKNIDHHKKKLKKMKKLLDDGKCSFQDCKESHQCWIAHAKRGNTYYLRKKVDKLFNELFKEYIKKEENNVSIIK